MAHCPNKSLSDWSDLVNKLGEDGAYYVFMKNGEKVPYLQGRESNRFIWDVENKLGLVTWRKEGGKNTKLYKGFSRDKAADLVDHIRENYVGDYTISRPAPDTQGEFALKIKGYPLPKGEVEEYMRKYNADKVEAIENVQFYKEFQEREREANEDILPLSVYEQRDLSQSSTTTTDEYVNELLSSEITNEITKALAQPINKFAIGKAAVQDTEIELKDFNLGIRKKGKDFQIWIDNKGTSLFSLLTSTIDVMMLSDDIAYIPNPNGFIFYEDFLKTDIAKRQKAQSLIANRFNIAIGTLNAFKEAGIREVQFPINFINNLNSEISPLFPSEYSSRPWGENQRNPTVAVQLNDLIAALKVKNEVAYKQSDILYNNTNEPVKNVMSTIQHEELTKVLMNTMPMVKEVIPDSSIKGIAELRSNGVIAYNPDKIIDSTLGHEFGHVLIDLMGGITDPFIQQAYEQLKDTDLARNVREAYKDKTEEVIQKEIIAEAIGREVADIFLTEQGRSNFTKWLIRFFRRLSARLGITKNNARELASGLTKGKPLPLSKYTGKQAETTQEQRDLNDITPEEEAQQEPAMKLTREEARILSDAEKVQQKAADIISTRLRKLSRAGGEGDIAELQRLLDTLEIDNAENANRALIQFSVNAVSYINKIYRDYERAKKTGEFDLKTAIRWNDVMQSYDILDSIASLLINHGLSATNPSFYRSTTNKYKNILGDAITKKNAVKHFFQEEGPKMASEILLPYSNNVAIITKNEKRREWVKNNQDKVKNMTMKEREAAEKKYAEEYMEQNAKLIVQEAKAKMIAEMDTASEDVGLLTRYLDTLLDTNDMVAAAAVKMFVIKNREAREDGLAFRDKAYELTRKLYKESNYSYLKTAPSKVYDFMLEKIKGKRTGYILSKFSSEMMDEYRKVVADAAQYPEGKAYGIRKKWKDENMPLNKTALNLALHDFLNKLEREGRLTKAEIASFDLNQEKPYQTRLRNSDIFHDVAVADEVDMWFRNNAMSFRTPSKKWINPDWAKFEKYMKENPESTKTLFYRHIVDSIKALDSNLPYNKRKFMQLPFMFKNADERIASGQKVGKAVLESFKDLTVMRSDDIEKGQYTDENDQPLNYVPWHFNRPGETTEHKITYELVRKGKPNKKKTAYIKADTADEAMAKFKRMHSLAVNVEIVSGEIQSWTDEDQSYDLMNLYQNYVKMASNYIAMTEILPTMEEVQRIINTRKYTAKDSSGNPIAKVVQGLNQRNLTREGVNSNLSAMFGDFMKMQMYGQMKKDEGSWDIMGWRFDKAKLGDILGKYSSYSLLGLNIVQGITNVNVGELTTMTEAIAGEYVTVKDMHKATVTYSKELGSMMGDIGELVPRSKLGKLNEKWDILNEYEGGNYKKNSRFAQLMQASTLFFMSHMGEHFMQTRMMIAMLSKVEAKNSKGEVIGNMYDMYYTTNEGELKLKDEVDLVKSNWTSEQQHLFGMKVKTLLSRLHGQYSELGKNAAQRWVVGRLALMFRKFIVPGYKRRWEKRKVNEFLEDEVEGSYRALFGFLGNSIKELRALGMASASDNWNKLTVKDQRNILRGASELAMATLIAGFAAVALSLRGEMDDDDEILGMDARYVMGALAYGFLRVKSEMFFFANPVETMTILKSPAVATSMIENIIKLIGQILVPTSGWATYERGSWKGSPKIYKTMVNLVPGIKQYYKAKNIEDSLTFFLH